MFYCFFFSLSVNAQQIDENKPIKDDSILNDIYVIVDKQPEFIGGEEKLQKFYRENSSVPVVISEDQIHTTVYYQIVIDETGNVSDFKILHSKSESLNRVTENLIKKMPKWSPGLKDDKAVKVSKNLSIKYATLD